MTVTLLTNFESFSSTSDMSDNLGDEPTTSLIYYGIALRLVFLRFMYFSDVGLLSRSQTLTQKAGEDLVSLAWCVLWALIDRKR